jgi:hypothetical protein
MRIFYPLDSSSGFFHLDTYDIVMVGRSPGIGLAFLAHPI